METILCNEGYDVELVDLYYNLVASLDDMKELVLDLNSIDSHRRVLTILRTLEIIIKESLNTSRSKWASYIMRKHQGIQLKSHNLL
jgi:hypothetical protein